jgi:23S rRNA (guanosine2251-2'-O)-methyltransferase
MSEGLVFGVQPVREALRAGRRFTALFVARGADAGTQRLLVEAQRAGVAVREVSRRELDQRADGERHQGVIGQLAADEEAVRYAELEDVLDAVAAQGEEPLVVILDGIQDPRNLGALIRSAWALGAHAVVIPEQRAAPVTAVAIKTSAGAATHIPIVRVTNVKHALTTCRDRGVWSAAAVLGGEAADRARLDGPLALVVGAEDKGVRPSVAEACDHRVAIPHARAFDSLNASVAGGILLYEIQRQRRAVRAPAPDPR